MPNQPRIAEVRWTRVAPLLLALGFAPLLVIFFANLWTRPQYRFFPFAVAGAWFLIRKRTRAAGAVNAGDARVTVAAGVLSFVLVIGATTLYSPWLAAVAAVCLGFGITWHAGGGKLVQAIAGPALLLLMVIPPPLDLDQTLTLKLREFAVVCGSRLLDALSVIHALNGNVLDIPHQRLFVAEACTGINSVLFVGAGTLFYGLWRERGATQIFVALVLNLSFVILGNLLRIAVAAAALSRYGVDLVQGWKHEAIGLALFATYVGLVFSTDRFIEIVGKARKQRRRNIRRREDVPVAAQPLSPRIVFSGAALFGLLGIVQLAQGINRFVQQPEAVAVAQTERMEFSLPREIGGWQLQNTKDASAAMQLVAVHSRVWEYRNANLIASVAIDYPFAEFHPLTVCYEQQGWKLLREAIDQAGARSDSYVRAEFNKNELVLGSLYFSHVTASGRPVKPSVGRWHRLRSSEPTHETCFQMQVFVQSFTPLHPADNEQVEAFFLEVRRLLTAQVIKQMPGKP